MKKIALQKLDQIIEKYSRIPDAEFLLYEAYIDYGYDSKGEPQAKLIFEVKEVNDKDLATALVEEVDPTGKTKPSEPLRIAALSSALNPGKKYTVLTGKQIAERASRLKALLELRLVQPPGKTPTDEQHFAVDIDTYTVADPMSPSGIQYRCIDGTLMRPNRAGEYRIKVAFNRFGRGSSSTVPIMILQDMLSNMGYGDEMRFKEYGLDGRYGKRTALAVSAFMRESAYVEKRKPKAYKGEFISTALGNALIRKCETRWHRFNYKVFLDADWILKARTLSKEMTRLRWRYHTTQLQTDLVNLSIASVDGGRFADDQASGIDDLSTAWEWGKYDRYTAEAVRRFQSAALQGCRYDPINQLIVYSLPEPTYHGNVTGIVDEETKVELIRWFDAVEQLTHIEDVTVLDRITPIYDLSDAVIESPLVGCCNLTHAGGTTELLISTPSTIDSKPVSATALKENLPYYLFLHRPVDDSRPFLYDNHQSSYTYDYHYTVIQVDEVTDLSKMQFYTGTLNEQKPVEYTAEKIDSGASLFGSNERGLRQDMKGNDIENVDTELIEKYRWIYDRKYLGFAEKLAQDGRKLWKVQLQLSDTIDAGIHLFKINGGSDSKSHPVSVFPENKDTFDILHLTDLHIAARHEEIGSYLGDKGDYNNPNERFRDILSQINQGEIAADLVIITGDLVDCANNHRPYDVLNDRHIFTPVFDKDANWRLLHYYITTDPGISVPVYMCLGNHDYRPNPTSINTYKNDLNISEEEADLYPFDTRDKSKLDEPAKKWLIDKCYSDSLYADKNAAQYYFENICPFTDYQRQLGNLNFLFMDTGMDENIFVNTYGVEDIDMLFGVIFGHNPSPKSVGFSSRQVEWLMRSLANSGETSNILCMHSPVIMPPLNEMVPRFDSPSFMENEISESIAEYRESSLIGGRDTLLELIGNGKFRLILTGHTHINCEIRCDSSLSPPKYYVGNYSEKKMNLDYFNEQGNSLLLSTVSSGVIGYELDIELDSYFDAFEKKDITQYFSHTGFRHIRIDGDGMFEEFADEGTWYKHGGSGVFPEDTESAIGKNDRDYFQSLVEHEAMPRLKKSFEIQNRQPGFNYAVDDKFCEHASIRAYIYFRSRPKPLDIKLSITPKHVSLEYKGILFDPTFFDLYRVEDEPREADRSDPNKESHLKYQTVDGKVISFTNREAQSGLLGSVAEIKEFMYKKRPRADSYAQPLIDYKWSSELPPEQFDNPSAKRNYDDEILSIIMERCFSVPVAYWGPDHAEYESQLEGNAYIIAMKRVWQNWEKYKELKENDEAVPNDLLHMLPLDGDLSLSVVENL